MYPPDSSGTGEVAEIGADGYLADSEPCGGVGDAHESVYGDQRLEPVATGSWQLVHCFVLFRNRKAPFATVTLVAFIVQRYAKLHLQLTSPRRAADRLKYLAGSEVAMGAWVGDIVPEEQAERIRAALAAVEELP